MSFSLGFVLPWVTFSLVGLNFVFLFCQVCYIFAAGPLKRPQCSLLKCKLIKVNSSSLKLNHFKADWLPRLGLLVHFSFSLLAHPHFWKTICHSCGIATICITDAGVRVQIVAVLMSPMKSEMGAEELISQPHYFLLSVPLLPLPLLLDTKCHGMTSNSKTMTSLRFTSAEGQVRSGETFWGCCVREKLLLWKSKMFVFNCFSPFQSLKGNISKNQKMSTLRIYASVKKPECFSMLLFLF